MWTQDETILQIDKQISYLHLQKYVLYIPEYKCMLLIILNDDQGQLLLLEIQLGDLWPEEEANFCLALEHQDTSRGQTQTKKEDNLKS